MSNTTETNNSSPPSNQFKIMESIDKKALAVLSPSQMGLIDLSVASVPTSTEKLCVSLSPKCIFPRSCLIRKCSLDVSHLELREFLDSHGATLQKRFPRRILPKLAHELFTDTGDRESAIQTASFFISHGRRVRNEFSASSQMASHGNSDTSEPTSLTSERSAQNVAMRLKDVENYLDGNLGDC